MRISFGKYLDRKGNTHLKGIDFEKEFAGCGCNVLTVGANGSGKTHAIIDRVEQVLKIDNTKVIIISSHIKELDRFSNIQNVTLIDYENLKDNEMDYSVKHSINVNCSKGITTWLFVECDTLFVDKEQTEFISNLWLLSRVHKCIMNIVTRDISEVPLNILCNTNVAEIFRLHYFNVQDCYSRELLKRLDIESNYMLTTIANLKRGEKVLVLNSKKIKLTGKDVHKH